MKIEICVDTVEGAAAAQEGGAHRVELCDNLLEGGTTPSAGCMQIARETVSIGLQVMIRPRGGDFLYRDDEFRVMQEDVKVARRLGADGVVFGCLTAAGDIHVEQTKALIELAAPMTVTFHRAFDMCRDPEVALEQLVTLGVARVLTSGQEATCIEGLEMIAQLQRQAAGRLVVMPGGGITARNVRRIVEATGVTEVHLSARTSVDSGMKFRNTRCFMGGTLRPSEFSRKTTDAQTVAEVVSSLSGAG